MFDYYPALTGPATVFGILILFGVIMAIYALIKALVLHRRFKKLRSHRKTALITSGVDKYLNYQSDAATHQEIINNKNADLVKRLFVVFVFVGIVTGLMRVDIRIIVGAPFLAVALIGVVEIVLNKIRHWKELPDVKNS